MGTLTPSDLKEVVKMTRDLRLLYVEDDEHARTTTLEMLENFFNDITTKEDGQEGLDAFNHKEFDLVITDINMPKMTGIEMLQEIRKKDLDIPVLILSAYNETAYFIETIKLGVDGYIIKPLEQFQFMTTLIRVVKKIEIEKERDRYRLHLEDEIKARTDELRHKFYYDDLTGLRNRVAFFEDLQTLSVPIVMIIDIDKFKIINEIYGMDVGSKVLQHFAGFLEAFIEGNSYRLYRLSADEFVLLDLVDYIDPQKYEHDIAKLLKQLTEFSVDLDNDQIAIDVSIGLSTSQQNTFESAKIALEYAKDRKRPYAMYSTAIDKRQEDYDALGWKSKIRKAIQGKRVVPVYQPIVDATGMVQKYEALMRLRDEYTDSLIAPGQFLEVAVKTRLYEELSRQIMLETLQRITKTNYTATLNFTYGDIRNKDLLFEIESFLRENEGLSHRLVFEITESESIENYDDMKGFINKFREFGVKFAVDDFGSGFSNFDYILAIRPDFLKIDGSLVKTIEHNERSFILVKAIVQFSHELGIEVIAEFVHSERVFEMLKKIGVDAFQGFYFSEPLLDFKA